MSRKLLNHKVDKEGVVEDKAVKVYKLQKPESKKGEHYKKKSKWRKTQIGIAEVK